MKWKRATPTAAVKLTAVGEPARYIQAPCASSQGMLALNIPVRRADLTKGSGAIVRQIAVDRLEHFIR